jgi:SAM-dependent methyltransferase
MSAAISAWIRFMVFVPRRIPRILGRIGRPRKHVASLNDDRFDLERGTDTHGIIKVYKLDFVNTSYIHSHGYEPCEAKRLCHDLAVPPIERAGYDFVDLGCGKGRALIIASEMGFRSVTGVELSPSLSKSAARNLEICGISGNVLTQDASSFEIPDTPCVCYLFDPFGKQVMQKFAGNVERRLGRSRADLWIVYQDPIHAQILESCRFLRVQERSPETVFFRAVT